jgi:hypothetical protein
LGSCDFLEKFLRTIGGRVGLGAIGFADGGDGAYPWQLIYHRELIEVAPHAVGWARDRVGNLDEPIRLVEGNPILSLAVGISHRASLQWRHLRRDQGEGCAVTAPIDIHLPSSIAHDGVAVRSTAAAQRVVENDRGAGGCTGCLRSRSPSSAS